MKISDVLTKEQIKELTEASDLRGFQALLTTWFLIGASFFLVAKWPNPLTILVAMILIGGRHLALAILMHDASHYSLFKTRWMNDFFGAWFCGHPIWLDLKRYRDHHWRHHQLAGTKDDPDYDLVKSYPVSKPSLARKFLRDLTGIVGLKRVFGLILMDFGIIQFTVSGKMTSLDQTKRSSLDVIKMGSKNLSVVFFANFVLFCILWALEHPWLYLLWVGSYLTTFSLILRVRSIAEHACTEQNIDPLKCTRTTYATFWERLTFAPHRVNYHLDHHLLVTTPYYKLPKLHQILKQKGAYQYAHLAKNYLEVLKISTQKP